MKATLTFDFDEGDTLVEFEAMYNGLDWKLVVEGLDTFLRSSIKHGDKSAPVEDALQQVRDQIYKLMEDRNLVLWE